MLRCCNITIFLLLLLCGFATIEQKNCYDVSGEIFVDVSGDVSGEVDFATVAHLCCYEISGEVSGEVSGDVSGEVDFATVEFFCCYNSINFLLPRLRRGLRRGHIFSFMFCVRTVFCYSAAKAERFAAKAGVLVAKAGLALF